MEASKNIIYYAYMLFITNANKCQQHYIFKSQLSEIVTFLREYYHANKNLLVHDYIYSSSYLRISDSVKIHHL